MRILGKRSLAASLKFLVDLTYYLVLVFGVLIILIVAAAPFLTRGKFETQIPVSFELDRDAYSIRSPELDIEDAQILEAKGQLQVKGVRFGRLAEQIAFLAVLLAITLLILRRLRAILSTLKQGTPFVPANVSRIRTIGILTIAVEIVSAAMTMWWAYQVTGPMRTTGLHFRTTFDLGGWGIFAGAILIVLSEVFRIGAEMKGDLEAARAIQFQLVPSPDFANGKIQIHCHMRPANTVGGDYYDMIPLSQDTVGIVVGDVSGKGMPAALLMTMLQGSLKTLISAGMRGEVLIQKMNDYLVRNTPENKMVTLFFGELNTTTGELAYTNAGHNPPLLLRASGQVQALDSNSLVLGLLPIACFTTDRVTLEPGDRLIIYTDGIVEAANKRDEEFGESRLRDFAVSRAKRPAPRFQEELYETVLAFCRPRHPVDDMTMMIVERLDSSGPMKHADGKGAIAVS
ncbi:MAG: DUF2975 domain-containing protein [Acidobacteria bacterium]|nr:MAG: DUF2975 domain-containing protein [Acidobacteriota bacterium]